MHPRRPLPPLAVALAFVAATATASDTWLAGLEQRLRAEGPDRVNVWLIAQRADMAELNRLTADCAPQAVDLAVQLNRGKHTKATDLHRESLRIAVGACTDYVLSRLTDKEVPRICASASAWTVSQTARELRRRIRALEADATLGATPHGQACSAAYRFELQNTRVGLRAGPSRPASR